MQIPPKKKSKFSFKNNAFLGYDDRTFDGHPKIDMHHITGIIILLIIIFGTRDPTNVNLFFQLTDKSFL